MVPAHPGGDTRVAGLFVEAMDESAGTRLTSTKCCGSWTTIYSFIVDADELMDEIGNYRVGQ